MAAPNRQWLQHVPSYFGMLVSIGTLIFSVGILYSDVQNLKKGVADLMIQASEQESIRGRVNILQMQAERSEQNQDKLDGKLDRIDKTLNNIEVGLARMEERLPEKKK